MNLNTHNRLIFSTNILITVYVVLVLIFNIAIPKGGFAIAGIPITWGYIFLLPIMIFGFFNVLCAKTISKGILISFFSIFPFVIYYVITLLLVQEITLSHGNLLSSILNFIIFPIIILGVFHKTIMHTLTAPKYQPYIIKLIGFIAIYGIVLFFYKIKTGHYFEIPYITTNIKDIGLLDDKYNNRGNGIFKLISTYNNGNIFGICSLFLLPFVQHTKWTKIVIRIAIFLTLSRTVWFGLIIYELYNYRKYLTKLIIFIPVLLGIIYCILTVILHKDLSYIFDPTFNGRIKPDDVEKLSFFSNFKEYNGIDEMIYTSIFKDLGFFGLLLFIIYWCGSYIVSIFFKTAQSPIQKKMQASVFSYLIVSSIDAAYLLIPVGVFFWIANTLILSNLIENEKNITKN